MGLVETGLSSERWLSRNEGGRRVDSTNAPYLLIFPGELCQAGCFAMAFRSTALHAWQAKTKRREKGNRTVERPRKRPAYHIVH